MEVTITVDNRGQYGGDQTYVLTVEDTGAREDNYEDDDRSPKPISIAEDQLHNFYPEGDIDKVQFLVKRGNEYEISTFGLSPGVDTYMSVAVDGRVYYDDDGGTDPLSSRVRFMALNEGVAVATITNKGRFGSDRWYHVSVTMIEPTPIPMDEYEVDDVVPKPIVVGQVQIHNLYPQLDVDRVQLRIKAGTVYEVYTYWAGGLPDVQVTPVCPAPLPPGVDTTIQVEGGGVTCEPLGCFNDDWGDYGWGPGYAAVCPGPLPGDYSSRVKFWAPYEGYVVITVRSKNNQYGPEIYYALYVWDLGPYATVTPTATPVTPTATPVTPTATPVTPTATPVTPTATPVTATATPITPMATSTPVTPTDTLTPTATYTAAPPTATPSTPYPSSASGLGLMAPIPRSTEEAEGLIQVGLGYSRPPGLASALDTGRNRMGRSLAPVQANAVEFVILLTLKAIVP